MKHNYDDRFENETSIDSIKESDKEESANLSVIPPLEKVKEGKGLKFFNSKQIIN